MDDATLRALIVEDDPGWQQMLGEILSDSGLTVSVTASFEEAQMRLHELPFRLAVVDLSLDKDNHRNRDGLRVLDAVRDYAPGCASLLLTGHATVELAVDAVTEHGAFSCLRKETFQRARFRELIRQALASASPLGTAKRGLSESTAPGTPEAGEPVPTAEAVIGLALIVEDDAGWRNLLAELLTEEGYQVQLCNGFGEALGYLGRERYSVAVVDLSLKGPAAARSRPLDGSAPPGTSEGYRLLAHTQAAGIPTILVSGVATPPEIQRAYSDYGVFACLEKQTFDRTAFRRTMSELQGTQRVQQSLGDLTDRELQVLKLLSTGLTNGEIATRLTISKNTVKRHLKTIFAKLGVHTRAAAAATAINAGLSSGWTSDRQP